MPLWLCEMVSNDPAFVHSVLRLAKGTAQHNTCCWLARWFDWSRWIAINSLWPFAVPISVLWVMMMRLGESTLLIFDVRNIVLGPKTKPAFTPGSLMSFTAFFPAFPVAAGAGPETTETREQASFHLVPRF